ncbi:Macrolide export ATP-binding/permease protein MacB [Acaryochloris thomasi RCC1774]|uniref:Macrolide export ATP-binding/permease protein MacB n=1 Tax=Acaryochloris thomasi RCC1774 TaxID=1764569 RepID=A0A2W1JJQ6_9CYAN|nr:ABC transporter permease [Acaryochloris thomasi]PZD73466.1 Macrolide export ATP-binding/permease protein MacB [Acaryochloris thomasi RCC1774]
MDIVESVKMAGATLIANRLRSSLTMLGMIIGNASVISMIAVGQGAEKYAAGQFESLGPNSLFIVPGSDRARRRTFEVPKTLVLADAEAIRTQVPTVQGVAPQIQEQLSVVYGNVNTSISVTGTDENYAAVRDHDVAQGRFITALDVKRGNPIAVIGSDVVDKVFGSTNPLGKQLRLNNLSFQIVGIMETKGSFLGSSQDDVIFIPLSVMADRLSGSTSPFGTQLTFISVSARNQASIPAAQFQIRNLLRLRHKIIDEDDFTVRSQKQALEIIGNVSGALTVMLAAIASISLLVGGIGIMNIMLVSVTERIQEIGLRKAIGASQQDILVQFMIEAIILSAAGGLIGTAVGVGGTLVVGAFTPLETGISIPAVVMAVSVSGGIGLFFGVVPARRAARMDPIVALRSA